MINNYKGDCFTFTLTNESMSDLLKLLEVLDKEEIDKLFKGEASIILKRGNEEVHLVKAELQGLN